MKRLFVILGLFAPSTAYAVGVVPPIIRLDKPDQPSDAPSGDDDPLKTIDRITKNARAVGDRLQNEDSGTDTQKAQDQLLKDIDSLLKPPPPMGNGGGGGGGSPPSPPPMSGGGGHGGSDSKPMGGDGGGSSKRQRGDRKEEPQGGGQEQKQPMGASGQEKKEPMVSGRNPDPNQPPMPGGEGSGKDGQGAAGDGGKKNSPNLPLDDPFSRRVWGHLPEKVRQQAMQSYREQFMPRYSEMLKQYYSTLNDKQTPNPSK